MLQNNCFRNKIKLCNNIFIEKALVVYFFFDNSATNCFSPNTFILRPSPSHTDFYETGLMSV